MVKMTSEIERKDFGRDPRSMIPRPGIPGHLLPEDGSSENPNSFPQQQDFSSWRNPLGSEFNNFYYSGGYTPFSDIRDSIAAIWSRASPSGEGVPLGYGQYEHPHGYNHMGHFSDVNVFGPDYTGAAAGYQQAPAYGYSQYTQWPENNGAARGYSYLDERNARENEAVQAVEAMKLTPKLEPNGYPPKKMSWANVASQPAKPTSMKSSKQKGGGGSGSVTASKISLANNNNDVETVGDEATSVNGGGKYTKPTNNHGPRGNRPKPSSGSGSHPILESLRSINDYNPRNFDLDVKNARFFVLKSFCEDDIHRSIKFEIWCSTEHGNKRLDAAFNERSGKGPIYLLFSVNGSGHFCGMAQMLTGLDYSQTKNVIWVQDKFKGQFKVRWIYVKDVPNSSLRHIKLENNENKPVTNSRDTQEIPPEKGKMVLKIIHSYKHFTSIFDDFIHYEKRQEIEENKKSERLNHHHHSSPNNDKQQQNEGSRGPRGSSNKTMNNNNNNNHHQERPARN